MRDVTETVEEISLITASILSKKFTEDLDSLVMGKYHQANIIDILVNLQKVGLIYYSFEDIKCGPSAFMKTIERATELADSIKRTCESTGT